MTNKASEQPGRGYRGSTVSVPSFCIYCFISIYICFMSVFLSFCLSVFPVFPYVVLSLFVHFFLAVFL